MDTISVVISAHNEEDMIEECLLSVPWAAERIVVDSGSTDKTARIARKAGATAVLRKANNPMLNVNKNWGFEKATSDWILSLDADERITKELGNEIQTCVRNSACNGYWIPRKNIIFGKWIRHGLWWPDHQLRLFRKGMGRFPCKHVHEYLKVEGMTENIASPMVHENYRSVSQFLSKAQLYSDSEVERLVSSGYRVSWQDAIRFPLSDFLKVYFAQNGYKDGLHGLVLSMLQATHALVVFAKYWERQSFPARDIALHEISDEISRGEKEMQHWIIEKKLTQTNSFLCKTFLKLRRLYAKTV